MRAWLTPDAALLQDPQECRTVSVPAGLWLYINGALELLAKEYNWELYGSATPEEMAQFFMGIVDEFGDSDCGMKFIDTPAATLFDETYTMFEGYTIIFPRSSLPSIAQNSTALYLNMRMVFSEANRDLRIQIPGGDAYQNFRCEGAFHTYWFNIIAPMVGDSVQFLTTATTGSTVQWRANLIGWL